MDDILRKYSPELRERVPHAQEGELGGADTTPVLSHHMPWRSAAPRSWRLRGVPTPHNVRIRKPRFNPAVCSNTRLTMFE